MRVRQLKVKVLSKLIVSILSFLLVSSLIYHLYRNRWFLTQTLGNYENTGVISRGGAGEEGRAHYTREDQVKEVRNAVAEYGINLVCSSEISLSRSIPDLRLPECKYWQYSENLPSASVVIIFYNEAMSLLLRNINSIINRTPRRLLEEIILVDDSSDKPDLRLALEMNVEKFGGIVKIVRNEERQGLIRARITGARHAKGSTLVYLDAHCEVNANWLPPLLEPIHRDRTVITIPVIDGIDKDTFAYTSSYDYNNPLRGIFSWGMLNKEISLPYNEMMMRPNRTTPYRTPTHQGGLFAVDKVYFSELGYYDEDLLVWGGENLDLSFKVWQSGGSILWIPCSRVGHVFRKMPDRLGTYHPPRKLYSISNIRRIVEVWLDDKHKEYFYTMNPFSRFVEMGNISKQLETKRRLRCRGFEWYMDYVAFDVYKDFPAPPVNLHWGELVNMATSMCLDNVDSAVPSDVEAKKCAGHGPGQIVRLNTMGQLGKGERCIVADGLSLSVKMVECTLGQTGGPWSYDVAEMILVNIESHRCLGQHPVTRRVVFLLCDARNTFMQWSFKEIRK